MTTRYIIMSRPKRGKDDGPMQPMSYGREDDLYPEMLLYRCEATSFESKREAEEALKETMIMADSSGAEWHKKVYFVLVPVRENKSE